MHGSFFRTWNTNQHSTFLVHSVCRSTHNIPTQDQARHHPKWIQGRILLDAQVASTYCDVQNLYAEDLATFQWPWRGQDIVGYQRHRLWCNSRKKFLWSQCVLISFCVHPLCIASQTDGMYGNFAGRDASRGMAKQSFDLGMTYIFSSWRFSYDLPLDMLTPVDQPLDKLDDLKSDEM